MKTFLRRPGNKTKHLKHIIPHIPKFIGTYYEPFLGTGAVYLNLLPKKAVLNDLNKDIISIWSLVKRNPDYIIQEIEKFKKQFLHLNNENKLKMCKNIVSKIDTYTGDKRTVNYLLMIYCSFNGSFIISNKLNMSALYINIFSKNQCHIFTEDYKSKILQLQNTLKNVKIESKDYSKVLENCKKGDFVFLDPPYIEDKTYAFGYNKNSKFDIVKLINEVKILDKKQVKWMMTQIDTNQIRNLFKGYRIITYNNNSNFSTVKTSKKELIITNY